MASLDDHFGENAEVDKATFEELRTYLIDNSADKSGFRRSRAIRNSLGRLSDNIPVRITQTPYFIREHDELPTSRIVSNEQIGSMSNCSVCHQRAKAGSYNENEINIPGLGRWDD